MVATGENLGNFTLTQGKKPGEWSIAMETIKYGCHPLRSLWNIWDRTEITMDLSRTEILLCFGRQRSDLEIKLWWQNCAVNQKGIFLSSLCTICSLKCSLLSLMSCFSKIYYSGLAFLFLCVCVFFFFFVVFCFCFCFPLKYSFWNNISGINGMDLSDGHHFEYSLKKRSYF